ncbi:MAG: phenylalanine--tRNA ligase subunit beta [Candidatus Homeothermus sp.]|nr:phenylalanine--tRNA ligase subunit beta [Candidatus Homeothermus sp.]
MNISYNWLKEYIDFRLSPEELADALTSIGLEVGTVEEVESIRGGLRGIVIGKVLTCVAHPNSDHLHITTVDLGNGEPTQIVCGAPNVAAGQTVVVATVGTTLYDGDNEFSIKKSKIRGVESFGMICAEDEIGIGTSHDGIIVLNEEVKPGTPAAEYYNLKSDWLIEVDLTPNRVDAASHYGVARDLSAWLACHAEPSQLRRPSVEAFATDRPDGAVAVEVDDYEACPRYSGVTIRNIKVGESPEWLKNYLSAIGQRPINNIVDITNFILLGMGQPLHCFDVDKIDGGKIVVRKCKQDTPFTTLDGVERKLDERDLMICNADKPMCIAGVFGGLDSGVTESTTSIFLESAYFNPTSIRKTARRHGLSTDASFRYERGTDPNITMYCLKLAALMVKELAGGEICGEPVDIYPKEIKPYPVTLRYDYLNALVGKDIPSEKVDSIVKSLEMEIVNHSDNSIDLLVPTYRVDVQRPCDVVEDVLRIYGYNNVDFSRNLRASLSFKTITDSSNELRELISNQLTATGFNEILNNSLTAESYYEGLTDEHHAPVKLLNPLSNDLNVMRMSLLFGGLEVIEHNVNRRDADLMLYEFGKIYSRDLSIESTAENPIAPYTETERLGLWLTGNIRTGNWARPEEKATFFDMKAIVANIFARLGINGKEIELKPVKSPFYSNAVEIATRSGKQLGTLGIVAKAMLKRCDVKQEVIYADLDWTALVKLAVKKKVTYAPLPKTHPVKRDLALLLDEAVTMAQVEKIVRDSEKKLLRGVELFDVYQGKNLEPGKKSYAISITLQDDEKTLQDKQIEAVMGKITANLQKQLGASLR